MADLRFERTEEMLQIRFMELLNQEPFEKISVSKLAKASKIDRTTFYAHYQNTYELAEKMIRQHIESIEIFFKKNREEKLKIDKQFSSYDYFNDELVSYLMKNRRDIQQLRLLSFGVNSFDSQLRNLFMIIYNQTFQLHHEEFLQYLITNLAMSNFDFIMNKQRAPTKEEIKTGLLKMEKYFS